MSLEKEIAELIANEVGWFNGWKASEEMFDKSCRKAARKVIKRLTKPAPDSATPDLKGSVLVTSVDGVIKTARAIPPSR